MLHSVVLAVALGCVALAATGGAAEAAPSPATSFKLTIVYGTNLMACVEPCG